MTTECKYLRLRKWDRLEDFREKIKNEKQKLELIEMKSMDDNDGTGTQLYIR